jgi:hypothetical protein
MSDTSNKLSLERLQDWKAQCDAQFLSLNARRIVKGEEGKPTIPMIGATSDHYRRVFVITIISDAYL